MLSSMLQTESWLSPNCGGQSNQVGLLVRERTGPSRQEHVGFLGFPLTCGVVGNQIKNHGGVY
jgi:hypothetical protein